MTSRAITWRELQKLIKEVPTDQLDGAVQIARRTDIDGVRIISTVIDMGADEDDPESTIWLWI